MSGLDGVQRYYAPYVKNHRPSPALWIEVVLAADAERAIREAVEAQKAQDLVTTILHSPDDGPKVFALIRAHDVSGVSGTGTVAYGVEFPDGCVALRWVGGNPTSVVFHDNGIASVKAIHGHGGNTRIAWLSEDLGPRADEMDDCEKRGRERAIRDCADRIDTYRDSLDDATRAIVGDHLTTAADELRRALLDGPR